MGNFDDYLLGQSIAFMQKHSQYGMSPLQSIKTQMGDENMEQRKFKVGDKIRVKNFAESKNGKLGKITDYDGTEWRPYEVELEDGSVWMLYNHEMELVEEKKMENVKSLLKSGDIVVLGSGEKAKVFLDYESDYYGKGILAFTDEDSFTALKSYNEDLFTSTKLKYYAINKIYRPKNDCYLMSKNLKNYDLIWERKEVKEMTMKEICEALGYDVKIKKEDK